MTRLRSLRGTIAMHVRTDWPVWAVLATAALVGVFVGRHHGVFHGIVGGVVALWGLTRALLAAETSGRREERDRRTAANGRG